MTSSDPELSPRTPGLAGMCLTRRPHIYLFSTLIIQLILSSSTFSGDYSTHFFPVFLLDDTQPTIHHEYTRDQDRAGARPAAQAEGSN